MAEGYTMKKHPLSNRLTPQQETAVDLIIAGQTDSEVAQSVGKSRSTINIWRKPRSALYGNAEQPSATGPGDPTHPFEHPRG